MEKEIIEKYIQFAIDNGYDEKRYFESDDLGYIYFGGVVVIQKTHITQIITSKEFIEAVARGLKDNGIQAEDLKIIIDGLTITQAIAIRDGKLEEFINNLLPKE